MHKSTQFAIIAASLVAFGPLCRLQAAVPQRVQTVAAADPQVKDDLFAGTEKFAQGATDVTDVNLDPQMLGMISGETGNLARKTNFMIVRSYKYPKPGLYKIDDIEQYRQKLRGNNWNCFVHVTKSETGESTDICSRPADNQGGKEMAILEVKPMELSFIHISGDASLIELGKLAGAIGAQAAAQAQRSMENNPPAAKSHPSQ